MSNYAIKVTVSKKQTGKYYASILIEIDTPEPKPSSKSKAIV